MQNQEDVRLRQMQSDIEQLEYLNQQLTEEYNRQSEDLRSAREQIDTLTKRFQKEQQTAEALREQLNHSKQVFASEHLATMLHSCILLIDTLLSVLPKEINDELRSRQSITVDQWREDTVRRLSDGWQATEMKQNGFVRLLLSIQACFLKRMFLLRMCFEAAIYRHYTIGRIAAQARQKEAELEQWEKERCSETEAKIKDLYAQFCQEKEAIIDCETKELKKRLGEADEKVLQLNQALEEKKQESGKYRASITVWQIVSAVLVIIIIFMFSALSSYLF